MGVLAALTGLNPETDQERQQVQNIVSGARQYLAALSGGSTLLADKDEDAYRKYVDVIFENLHHFHPQMADQWPDGLQVRKYFDKGGVLKMSKNRLIGRNDCLQGFKKLRQLHPDSMDAIEGDTWELPDAQKWLDCVFNAKNTENIP